MPKNDPIGQSDFDDLVSKFVMNTMVPFLVVNDASFKPMFKSLQVAYQIPCFKQLLGHGTGVKIITINTISPCHGFEFISRWDFFIDLDSSLRYFLFPQNITWCICEKYTHIGNQGCATVN